MKKQLAGWFNNIGPRRNPDEFEAKQLVKIFGINVPDGIRLQKDDKLDADCIQAPCAIKLCNSNVAHKTEINGVMLNNTKENLMANIDRMRQRFPGDSLLIENQVSFIGPEIIIGIVRDETLGHAVMVGNGGIYTEIYRDTAFRLAPCMPADAHDMIEELKISPVFGDFRRIAIDKEQLARSIVKVSRIAEVMEDRLNQLDINPIVYTGSEWMALDIQIVLEPQD